MLVSVDRERVGASGRVKSAIYFAEICWEVVLFKLNYAVDELVAVASTRYRRGDSRSNGHVEGNGQGGGLRRVASGYQRGGASYPRRSRGSTPNCMRKPSGKHTLGRRALRVSAIG